MHLYHLGHPVAGDPLYGDPAMQKEIPRLMLHARRIALALPSGTDLVVEAPVPQSFADLTSRFF